MSVQTVKATINGQEYTLTLNSSTGKYEATVTAPSKSSFNNSGGYYPVSVTATDDAGNSTTVGASDATLGTSLRLVVKERVAPVISITYPAASAYITSNKPVIKWNVTDDDSGVNSDTISIKIDGGNAITSGITKTAITGGYECSYTPSSAMADGEHTVVFNASDNDGNAATQKSVTFTVDTVAPVLNVTSPVDGSVTNTSTCTVSGTTNDATSSPVTVTVNGASVTVNANGSFSKAITLSEGENTITIVATDAAGKTTTVTRTVTLDTGAPAFVSVTINPNPVDAGNTYVISVSVTDS
jgi:hypothetical protein